MKKPLLEHALAYKKIIKQFQILQKKIKLKNSDIKTLKNKKNIKQSDNSRLRNY